MNHESHYNLLLSKIIGLIFLSSLLLFVLKKITTQINIILQEKINTRESIDPHF